MNFLKYLILVFLVFIGTSCNRDVDVKKEEKEIKFVIESETKSYVAKNHEKHAELFVQDSSFIILVASKYNFGYVEGWELADKYNKINFEKDPTPSGIKFVNEDYKIKIYAGTAWAVYNEMVYDVNGDFVKKVINVRFLEKNNGNWKIVFLGDVNTTSYKNN